MNEQNNYFLNIMKIIHTTFYSKHIWFDKFLDDQISFEKL